MSLTPEQIAQMDQITGLNKGASATASQPTPQSRIAELQQIARTHTPDPLSSVHIGGGTGEIGRKGMDAVGMTPALDTLQKNVQNVTDPTHDHGLTDPIQDIGSGMQIASAMNPGKSLATTAISGAAQLAGGDIGAKKPIGETVKDAAIGAAAAPVLGYAGKAVSALGKGLAKAVIPVNIKEAGLLQAYKASASFADRFKAVLGVADKEPPTTEGGTAFEHGLMGPESWIGVQAKRAAGTIWNDLVKPQLDNSPVKVDMNDFFGKVEQRIIAENPELSRQKSLVTALNALKDDYKNTSNVPLAQLQQFKSGWAEFVPDKAYRGESIAGAFREVQNIAASEARRKIYKELGDGVKQAYFDWGNLQGLQALGKQAMTGSKLKGGAGRFLSGLWEMATVPAGTIGGQTLYKVGQGIELLAPPGAKTLRDLVDSLNNGTGQENMSPNEVLPPANPELPQQQIPGQSAEAISSPNGGTENPISKAAGAVGNYFKEGLDPANSKLLHGTPEEKKQVAMGAIDNATGMGSVGAVGKEATVALKGAQTYAKEAAGFITKQPSSGVIKTLKDFLTWFDGDHSVLQGETNPGFLKNTRNVLKKEAGLDTFDWSDLKLAKFATAVEDHVKTLDAKYANPQTIEALLEKNGGWKPGTKAIFDKAILAKNATTIRKMLPDVPAEYKQRFGSDLQKILQGDKATQ